MITAVIGVGSNLERPAQQVALACERLVALEGIQGVKRSSLYQSVPWGPQDQPDFINAVVMLTTSFSPHALLDALQQLECQQGRVPSAKRWGPRIVDLDLLLYGEQVIKTDRLVVPHVGLTEREFVLYPLAEIAPDLILPSGESILALTEKCPLRGLRRLAIEDEV